MASSSRVYGSTALGALVGAVVALLVFVPLLLLLESRTDMGFMGIVSAVVFTLWFATIGGRFGHKVGTHEEKQGRTSGTLTEDGWWSGPGWSLLITSDGVDLSDSSGERRFAGPDLADLVVRRQGADWFLETPLGVRPLTGLDEDRAREIQGRLLDLHPGE